MKARGSTAIPIVLGALTVALTIALLIGWTLIFAKLGALTETSAGGVTILVVGIVSFAMVMGAVIHLVVRVLTHVREVRQQDSFIDNVTHELKTPLASIKLGLETLERDGLTPDQRELLRVNMLEDVDRLNAFIDDILEASRLVHAVRGRSLASVELLPVIEHNVTAIARRHGVDPNHIVLDVPAQLTVRTDPTALDIVLKNLLDNAVKYSPAPIDIRVAAQRSDNRISVTVTDRGIGIPPAYRRKVGIRFFRVPSEEVRSRRGTGLGLFVVGSIVRSLGGHISITSPGPGLGTSVQVTLPSSPE